MAVAHVLKDELLTAPRDVGCIPGASPKPLALKINELAHNINQSANFHRVYGWVDGLSCVYSFNKFLILLFSQSYRAYKDNLHEWLIHPGGFLPFLIAEIIIITLISSIGNGGLKEDNPTDSQAWCRDYWPYIRDVMKGAKNGFKGIMGITGILTALGMLTKDNFISFALPVGLSFGIVGMFNRLYNRRVNDARFELTQDNKTLLKQLKQRNQFLQEKQDLQRRIDALYQELEEIFKDREKYNQTKAKINELKDKLKALKAKHSDVDIPKMFEDYDAIMQSMTTHHATYQYRMLLSNAIGGIVDGPYLYAGVMNLAVLNGAILTAMSGILAVFLVACIINRVQEEKEKQRRFLRSQLETQLSFHTNKLINAQNAFYEFLRKNPQAGKKEKNQRYQEFKTLFEKRNETLEELKNVTQPTYKQAIIAGVQDGLTAFGVVSCLYFGLGIVFFLSGASFPPALIVANMCFGIAAMTLFSLLRVFHVKQDIIKHENFFSNDKQIQEQIQDEEYDPNGAWFSIVNCNTDGLTKGEFYFQQFLEVFRCLFNGLYKSQNLTDFFFTSFKEETEDGHTVEPTPMVIFWGLCSIFYGACLALRALGRGFGKKEKPKDCARKKESVDETPKEKPAITHTTQSAERRQSLVIKSTAKNQFSFFKQRHQAPRSKTCNDIVIPKDFAEDKAQLLLAL